MASLPTIGPLGYQQTFQVGTFDIDHRKQLHLPALLRQMQEAAMQNVIQLQLSIWDLEPQHLAWILMRQSVHIHRLPTLGESYTIYTQPTGFERVFTFRDFHIYDEKQQLIATSATTWLLFNTQTRRMARIPQNILTFQAQIPDTITRLPHALDKLPMKDFANATPSWQASNSNPQNTSTPKLPNTQTPKPQNPSNQSPPHPPIQSSTHPSTDSPNQSPYNSLNQSPPNAPSPPYTVRWYDLDFNMHLNNTYYIKWLLEACPKEQLEKGALQRADFLFRTEAQLDDQVQAASKYLSDTSYLNTLTRNADQKVLALAQFHWK